MSLKAALAGGGRSGFRLRGLSLLIAATVVYIAAIVATLYTLEYTYYLPAKSAVIRERVSQGVFFEPEVIFGAGQAVRNFTQAWVNEAPADRLNAFRDEARARLQAVLDSNSAVVRASLETLDGYPLIEVQDFSRYGPQHNWTNSIFTRSLVQMTQQNVAGGDNQARAFFRMYITTPLNDPAIERITNFYRWLMVGLVLLYTLIYYFLLRFVLRPASRVLTFMQMQRPGASPIISHPRTELERAYNGLARDASLSRLSKQLREIISSENLSHVEPVLHRLPALVNLQTGIQSCQIWVLGRAGDEADWHCERLYEEKGPGDIAAERLRPFLLQRLRELPPDKHQEKWENQVLRWEESSGTVRSLFLEAIDSGRDRLLLFVIRNPSRAMTPQSFWVLFYSRVAQEVRYAISSIEEQRRLILQEKSKANISLSRNLGHDLTNIIATGKLELMAVRTFLSMNPEDMKKSPNKERIFRESLEALLNNTRFLQEIVNLYRSFSYLEKPKFEMIDLNELVHDVLQLYRLSVSKNIETMEKLAPAVPLTRVEPRLLRLALFNVLTNAAEAIKRTETVDHQKGTIWVSTLHNAARNTVDIVVEDSGTGICDGQGNLLSADEISQIFRLGFSTKANQEGEGLGLNWVQTIVREFHGGTIAAANRTAGGALFSISLPIITESTTPPSGERTATPHMQDNQPQRGGVTAP